MPLYIPIVYHVFVHVAWNPQKFLHLKRDKHIFCGGFRVTTRKKGKYDIIRCDAGKEIQ